MTRGSERGIRVEESHFNSNPYFWPSIPTVSGQIENTMLINLMKDQLLPEKGCELTPSYYPTLLTVPASVSLPSGISMNTESKLDQLTPHMQASVTQNIMVVPVPSIGPMTAVSPVLRGGAESQSRGPGLAITSPSGSLVTTASSAQTFSILAPMRVSVLPSGSQKIASTLTKEGGGGGGGGGNMKKWMLEPGLLEMNELCVFSPEVDDDHQKDSRTANTSYLAQHLQIHLGPNNNCSDRQKAFHQLSHFQQHTRIHTGDGPYKCALPGCEKAFTQLSSLHSHKWQHNTDKSFKCYNCHQSYTEPDSLEVQLSMHMVKHVKLDTFTICIRAYSSETYLMKHMRKHNPPHLQAFRQWPRYCPWLLSGFTFRIMRKKQRESL
uniref:C2H2-type domain-containing protein n=1 Tax=Spermophilus dauricus TaxID=99837 RepID=A0A8C9PKI4_SPEDA